MKTKQKTLITITCLVIPVAVYAAVTTADNLNVRDTSEDPNTTGGTSIAVGYDNVASANSLTVGGRSYTHDLSFSSGHSNDVKNLSAAIGHGNNVNYNATGPYPRHSLAVGQINSILGSSSFVSGYNNDVSAGTSSAQGKGLLITDGNTHVVGTYNADTQDVLFMVGDGADASNRSNAFEVHENGDVIINKAQGDIDMGGFGS